MRMKILFVASGVVLGLALSMVVLSARDFCENRFAETAIDYVRIFALSFVAAIFSGALFTGSWTEITRTEP